MDLSLYIITDENLTLEKGLVEKVRLALEGGATAVQYRAKNKTAKQMYREANALRKLCREKGVPFIVNDRVDLAVAVNSDGVHVGQEDLPVEAVRRIVGWERIVGLSTKNLSQVREANGLPVDYIGFGSVFPTGTKEDATVSGIEMLKEAVKLSIQPVVAIGGINLSNIDRVIETGCKNVAVVSAVFSAEDVLTATKKLKEKLKKG
ncbi:MAG: thiamine phosphate synthase [Aquificae bacterium]|nr:thiamine phosphate synthase [Aquificota bacterium]